ncbi:MAG TPA: peptidase M48 [Cyanobacteria bacterium UBA11149]|nr:peptidase M48 [Cyanobacteria bacterium UBA11366]HBS70665.1 peptidase M48 [Cyanobacteria bacterium UBA11153]HBW89311.1 peptidase M48 [Cyanobacteria bacterium UBA11149]
MTNNTFSNRNPPPSNRQLLILLGLCLGFIVGVAWLLNWALNGIIELIPPSLEQKLGAIVVPVYEKQSQPSPTQTTLNQLLDRLEKKLPSSQGQDYRVLYLPTSTVNAMALPGNAIVIYGGLLKEMESENELMMILGHELGHFAHRDHLRGLGRALLVRIALAYFIGDAGGLQSAAASSIAAIGESKFSQSQELEADEFGLTLLYNTYGHVAGATDFFAQSSKGIAGNIDFLSTHPASRKRVVELENLIKKRGYEVKKLSPLPETLKGLELK